MKQKKSKIEHSNKRNDRRAKTDASQEVRKNHDMEKMHHTKLSVHNPGDRKEILKERARMLAEESKEKEMKEGYIEVVEFMLAYERYGIESSRIREVYPLKEFTPVPCTPSFVLGITNVRGQIISVIDIKTFFNLPTKGLSDLNRAIIVESDGMELGILADYVIGVRMIPLNEIQPTLPTLKDVRSEYIRGITEDRLVILDIEKILADPKIVVYEEVET